MLDLLWPFALALLPLPLIVRWLMPARNAGQAALKVADTGFWQVSDSLAGKPSAPRSVSWLFLFLFF